MAGSDTDPEYGTPGPLTKTGVTKYSSQDFIPSETHSTDNESQRDSSLPIIGDTGINRDNQIDVNGENPKSKVIRVRLNQAQTGAERSRAFRARQKALLQQQDKQQEPDAINNIETTEDNQVPGPSDIRTGEKKAKSTGRRQKKKYDSEESKKQAAAERARERRAKKRLENLKKKKVLLICGLCGDTYMDYYSMEIHQKTHNPNIEENVDGSDINNIRTGNTPE